MVTVGSRLAPMNKITGILRTWCWSRITERSLGILFQM